MEEERIYKAKRRLKGVLYRGFIMKTTKNCYPYCGSKDITIDVDVTVGTRFENGMLILERKKKNEYS